MMNSRYASSPPRSGLYCDKYKNPDVEAVFIKKGALVLTDESGISMSKEDFDKYSLLCLQSVIFHCFDVVLAQCPDLSSIMYMKHALTQKQKLFIDLFMQ